MNAMQRGRVMVMRGIIAIAVRKGDHHGIRAGLGCVLACLLLVSSDATADRPQQPEFVPDELIVSFEAPPDTEQLQALQRQFTLIVGWRALHHAPQPLNEPNRVHPLAKVRVAKLVPNANLVTLSDQLRQSPGIRYVHPNTYLMFDHEPNDPLFREQYGPQIIEAPAAWDITMGNASVVIAVIDTGIYFEHEEFQDDAIWTNTGEIPGNGVDDDRNGYVDDVVGWDFRDMDNDPSDPGGHGSHVSGVIGARMNNELGIAGIAQVGIMPLRAATLENAAMAIDYASDMGAQAINMSWSAPDNELIFEAIQRAWDNGVTMVSSAGNDNNGDPAFPQDYREVIAVSATDANDERGAFSNFGNIDVAAPGVDILTVGRDDGPDGYELATGTSEASPHVCGLVGLMYSVDPTLTPQEVQDLLCANADDLGDPGFDIYFGCGRINARRTIEAVVANLDCTGDIDDDGLVGASDLIALLGAWGANQGHPADLDGDGVVGTGDLILLLGNWGPCI